MTALAHHTHPVTRAVSGARDQLSEVAGTPLWSMGPAETTSTIAEVAAAEAQLAELKARLLTQAKQLDLPAGAAASSTANWHAVTTRTTRAAAHRTMRLTDGLETHEPTRAALAAGDLHVEQAQVILHALAQLPEDLDPDLLAQAERHLLDRAQEFDAKALRTLGRRVLDVVAPDAADAHEAKLLEKEERDAAAATRLTMWDDGHGKTHDRFTLPNHVAAAFKKALLAFAAPKHQATTQGPQGPLGERKPTPERLGAAFVEMIQRYPTKRLPKAGGLNATAVVLIQLDTLMGGLKAAHLDTGDTISPALARKLACEAGIIPAVLDGDSQPLDLGRTKRYATEPQRIAKIIQTQGRCEVDGCDNPATHAHHNQRWSDDGPTDLNNLIAICPWHHTRAHDQAYDMTRLPTGKYTFHRRT